MNTNPILTGSQVYGVPDADSDLDMVVLVSPAVIETLRRFCDADDKEKVKNDSDAGPTAGRGQSASLRFGKLNLICVSDPVAFACWQIGTRQLKADVEQTDRPVDREVAIAFFDALRRHMGLWESPPTVQDVKRAKQRASCPVEIGDGVEFTYGRCTNQQGLVTDIDELDERVTVSHRGKDWVVPWNLVKKLPGNPLPGYRRGRASTDEDSIPF